jgi:uncharacterized membrane protein
MRRMVLPHACLVVAAALEIAFEVRWSQELRSPVWIWLLLEPFAALIGLAFAWRWQDSLRLFPLAAIALAFTVAVALAHQAIGIHGDQDPNQVYAAQGNQLLHGHYPESEYPSGAVLLFALEALISGGSSTQTSNRFLMIPFQLLCVIGIWSVRTQYSSWLAAVVAIWPLNTYYWENRFDLVPAALMVIGLALARRRTWGWSGVALGLGAAVKWTPAASFVILVAWLLASGWSRAALRHAAAFVGVFATVTLPFLIWAPHRVMQAYTRQGGRGITNESVWYFPLHLLGQTGRDTRMWASAGAPHWANVFAVFTQAVLICTLLALAIFARRHIQAGLAVAALSPLIFLLTNRVFSPQFVLVLVAGWTLAGALVVSGRLEELKLGIIAVTASFANLFVYPYDPPYHVTTWPAFSALMYVAALLATGLLVRRAVLMIREGAEPRLGS